MTGSVIERHDRGKVLSLVFLTLILLAVPSVANADIFSSDTCEIEVASTCESKTDRGSTVMVIVDSDGESWTVDKRGADLPKVGETIEAHFENDKVVGWRDVSKAELKARSDARDRKRADELAGCFALGAILVTTLVISALLVVIEEIVLDRFY